METLDGGQREDRMWVGVSIPHPILYPVYLDPGPSHRATILSSAEHLSILGVETKLSLSSEHHRIPDTLLKSPDAAAHGGSRP
jgi:hypothetical protein